SRIVLPASSLDYRGSLLDDKEHLELDDRLILYIPHVVLFSSLFSLGVCYKTPVISGPKGLFKLIPSSFKEQGDKNFFIIFLSNLF
ncbi:unnamed protein product, partial [marine sediment metagenome]